MVAITHVGLTVPDIHKAIQWYETTLEMELIAGPFTSRLSSQDNADNNMTRDLLGNEIKEVKNAHLTADNQVGLELFEFNNPKTPSGQDTVPWKPGFFHLCIVSKNVERLADRIEQNGGKKRSSAWQPIPAKPYTLLYCEDPFGNIIEIYSHSTERIYANTENL